MNNQIDKETQQVADRMICAMARLLEDRQRVFQGVSSHMPLVSVLLARALHAPDLVHLNIAGGVSPGGHTIDTFSSAGPELYRKGTGYFPLQDIFDLSMRGGLDVAFLSGVQFDREGHVNASVIGDYHRPKVRLPGGAGSAVLIPTAQRVILWRTKHDRRTFVEEVDFVTAKGNAWRLVTPLCIFAFEENMWKLDSLFPGVSLQEVEENTGFPIVYGELKYCPPVSQREQELLTRIDPGNTRAMEFVR